MTTKIAVNGLGRIGKLVVRALIDRTPAGIEPVLLNDPAGTPEVHAHLLAFDTVHGRWDTPVAASDCALLLAGLGGAPST